MSRKINIEKKFLIKQYIRNKKSAYKIAEEFGCSDCFIYKKLKEYNIKTRTLSEAHADFFGKNNPAYKDGRRNKLFICKEKNCNNKIKYITLMCGTGRCKDCGNKLQAKKRTGRKRPDLTEINKKRLGPLHPMYIEGNSIIYPVAFNTALKEKIRTRDKRKCQMPGCKNKRYRRKLDVHHIDYDKDNIEPENLTSLCSPCHMTTNGNREYWEEYFTNKGKA